MSLSKAEELLMCDLLYSKEQARFIVRQFDKNGDGKLSTKEVEQFKDSVKQTSVYELGQTVRRSTIAVTPTALPRPRALSAACTPRRASAQLITSP